MGIDAYNTLPEGTKKKDVIEFLELLGYKSLDNKYFYFFSEDDYKFVTGISATVFDGDQIEVHTRTTIFRSKGDSDFHNYTIRQLKKRFGGTFSSDYGKGRYVLSPPVDREKDESGCFIAYRNFRNNIVTANIYLDSREIKFGIELTSEIIKDYPFIASIHPIIISNNILIPYIVSCVEDYFKSSYIALLKYSNKKISVLKNSRILPEDLLSISKGELTVEMAITKTMSFQNINKINSYFRDLDNSLDISGTLKKPFRRRKRSLFDSINNIFEQRHLLIHQNTVSSDYTTEKITKDINDVKEAIKRVYKKIIITYGWQDETY